MGTWVREHEIYPYGRSFENTQNVLRYDKQTTIITTHVVSGQTLP